MAEATLHTHLKSLQSLLRKLRSSAPSVDVKASIKEALQNLEVISEVLTTSEILNRIDQELNETLEPEQIVETICQWAKSLGCEAIEAEGRPGWGRIFDGAERISVMSRKWI